MTMFIFIKETINLYLVKIKKIDQASQSTMLNVLFIYIHQFTELMEPIFSKPYTVI